MSSLSIVSNTLSRLKIEAVSWTMQKESIIRSTTISVKFVKVELQIILVLKTDFGLVINAIISISK